MNSQYTEEAKARFEGTEAYKEFESKTAGYTEKTLKSAESGMDTILAKFAQCKDSGCAPDSAQAQTLVTELQDFIAGHFYTCTDEILGGLGAMYTADERFRQNIDKHGCGTAEFISKATTVYCKQNT